MQSYELFVDRDDDELLGEEVDLRRPLSDTPVPLVLAVKCLSTGLKRGAKTVDLLSDMDLLVEERVEKIDLVCELGFLLTQIAQPQPA